MHWLNMQCYIVFCTHAVKLEGVASLVLLTNKKPLMLLYHGIRHRVKTYIKVMSKWARWPFKSPAPRLFTQPFVQAQIGEIIKASLAFVRRINRRSVNSPHRGPVTRKMFSFDDVTIIRLQFNRSIPCMAYAFVIYVLKADDIHLPVRNIYRGKLGCHQTPYSYIKC